MTTLPQLRFFGVENPARLVVGAVNAGLIQFTAAARKIPPRYTREERLKFWRQHQKRRRALEALNGRTARGTKRKQHYSPTEAARLRARLCMRRRAARFTALGLTAKGTPRIYAPRGTKYQAKVKARLRMRKNYWRRRAIFFSQGLTSYGTPRIHRLKRFPMFQPAKSL